MKAKYFIAITTLVAFAACKDNKSDPPVSKQFCLSDTMKHMITIDTAQICALTNETRLSGEISFDENKVVKIFPRSSGQVTESHVSLGDKVQAGQVLAVIKSADVAGNYEDLSSAEADIAIAKRRLDNEESLYQSGIASEREYTEAKENYEKALAAKRKIQSIISINGGSGSSASGTYVITSPITGYLVEKNVNTGNFIRQDMSQNLFTISDLKDVWVQANVFENDIAKMHTGSNVQITTLAYPDKTFTGKVDKIGDMLDATNKTLQVRIVLPNPDFLLKPQMFATVIVSDTSGQTATCIPTKALLAEDGVNYVVKYNNDCNMQVEPVQILKTIGDKTYITSGVEKGQKLITQNQLLIFQQLMGE
jgi:cobalt-zinc-cadmium efflux system membrane fusion protein